MLQSVKVLGIFFVIFYFSNPSINNIWKNPSPLLFLSLSELIGTWDYD